MTVEGQKVFGERKMSHSSEGRTSKLLPISNMYKDVTCSLWSDGRMVGCLGLMLRTGAFVLSCIARKHQNQDKSPKNMLKCARNEPLSMEDAVMDRQLGG